MSTILIASVSLYCFFVRCEVGGLGGQYFSSQVHSQVGQQVSTTKEEEGVRVENDEALRQRLTPTQYQVTQENATETPFDNPYWDNKEAGIYVDIIDGTPLFSSRDKYDSGTGWPTFSQPVNTEVLQELSDNLLAEERIEVRGKGSNSHLGHLFDDGPPQYGGNRYCINSAALKFIPLALMEQEGYGYMKSYVEKKQDR